MGVCASVHVCVCMYREHRQTLHVLLNNFYFFFLTFETLNLFATLAGCKLRDLPVSAPALGAQALIT